MLHLPETHYLFLAHWMQPIHTSLQCNFRSDGDEEPEKNNTQL